MISNSMFKNTVLFLVLAIVSCGNSIRNAETKIESQKEKATSHEKAIAEIKTGADNFEAYFPVLKNKKVGIVTNQTGILSNKAHLVDFLLEQNIAIQKIYAPDNMAFAERPMPENSSKTAKIPKPDCPLFPYTATTKKQNRNN